jgi:hypothetical protein
MLADVTRDELPQHSGKHVTILLEGNQDHKSATLLADGANPAYLRVLMLPKPGEVWADMENYPLTDADVESLSLRGDADGGLIGAIYLKRDGNSLSWDAASQPAAE